MRSKTVKINERSITIKEQKISSLKDEMLLKFEPAWKAVTSSDTSQLIDKLGEQMQEIFPELKQVKFEDCYPSEIEAFLEAWIEVNFTGLKRLVGPLLSLAKTGLQLSGSSSASASVIPIIGKSLPYQN